MNYRFNKKNLGMVVFCVTIAKKTKSFLTLPLIKVYKYLIILYFIIVRYKVRIRLETG